ncbi:MAG: Unknown protein [uncultured Sulfurovum sp.]|uniref:Lipoprotein n=1 Tax=uncultured Sulfurovum sp. TaxID=269237 RepID=A0A6S6S627_9BACT|nr:MAG: Unknown protein [uncultured Sulfurovum sp.]
MKYGSVIIFGIVSATMLIISCVSLNVSKFYNELEFNSFITLDSKPTLVLRDRKVYAGVGESN